MARAIRTTLLISFATAEVVCASLMLAGRGTLPGFCYLLCTLALLSAAVVSAREPLVRNFFLVQGFAVASFVALFWADSSAHAATANIRLAGTTYQLAPVLAGLLFATIVLAHLARRSTVAHACHCS